jgi:hypothetical protein
MLDKLPQELIVAITDHLGMNDKLILIKTCQHVFDMVSGTNLFSELDILKCKKKTPDIIVKFKDNPSFGAQVKLLSISKVYISDDFSTIFPNVTRLITRKLSRYQLQPLEDFSKCPMVQWSKTLEVYNSSPDWPEAIPVLKTTVFPQLTELILGRPNEFGDKNEGFDIPYFLPVFRNVPSLKKLTLWRTPIDLAFLDEIHTNCPHLKSLTI